jgi:hypothetical protein
VTPRVPSPVATTPRAAASAAASHDGSLVLSSGVGTPAWAAAAVVAAMQPGPRTQAHSEVEEGHRLVHDSASGARAHGSASEAAALQGGGAGRADDEPQLDDADAQALALAIQLSLADMVGLMLGKSKCRQHMLEQHINSTVKSIAVYSVWLCLLKGSELLVLQRLSSICVARLAMPGLCRGQLSHSRATSLAFKVLRRFCYCCSQLEI